MKQITALLLCTVLASSGCAAQYRPRLQAAQRPVLTASDHALLADFARQLPVGTRVRARLAGNRTVHGVLIKTTDSAVVIQRHGRVPEPLAELPFQDLLALEPDRPGGGIGRAVGLAAVTGAGAALGVLFILLSIYSD